MITGRGGQTRGADCSLRKRRQFSSQGISDLICSEYDHIDDDHTDDDHTDDGQTDHTDEDNTKNCSALEANYGFLWVIHFPSGCEDALSGGRQIH